MPSKQIASWAVIVVLALDGCRKPGPAVFLSKHALLANGYDTATLEIANASAMPQIDFAGNRLGARLSVPIEVDGKWRTRLRAGVLPGMVRVDVGAGGRQFEEGIRLEPETSDWAGDGIPDFLRLDELENQEAFRAWFTFLAEAQYFAPKGQRAAEVRDCSSLVRYAFREALREHDAAWVRQARIAFAPPGASIEKYSFPRTPLGPNVFRIQPGTYSPGDLAAGKFAEFADAKTLKECNTFFISRDLARAQSGDLLFYRRQTTRGISYHSMIFVGLSRVNADGGIYVVYDTGPDGTGEGEIRRLTTNQLLHYPDPEWQAIAANPFFLGVYRWKILKAHS